VAPLKAVVGCITDEGFLFREIHAEGEQQTAHFQSGFAILDRRDSLTLSLELYHRFVVRKAEGERGPWTASTVEYVYELSDESDNLIAAWHWHPGTMRPADAVQWPHMHAQGSHARPTLHRLHLPTGRVSLEAVVRFLIIDLDVIPRREYWSAILDRHESAFHRVRSWA
jgi:hypothetical protein